MPKKQRRQLKDKSSCLLLKKRVHPVLIKTDTSHFLHMVEHLENLRKQSCYLESLQILSRNTDLVHSTVLKDKGLIKNSISYIKQTISPILFSIISAPNSSLIWNHTCRTIMILQSAIRSIKTRRKIKPDSKITTEDKVLMPLKRSKIRWTN